MSTMVAILKVAHSELAECRDALEEAHKIAEGVERFSSLYRACSRAQIAKDRIDDVARIFSEGGLRILSKALETTIYQILLSHHTQSIKSASCSVDIALILVKDIIERRQE